MIKSLQRGIILWVQAKTGLTSILVAWLGDCRRRQARSISYRIGGAKFPQARGEKRPSRIPPSSPCGLGVRAELVRDWPGVLSNRSQSMTNESLVDFTMQKRKLENFELRPADEPRAFRPENWN